MLRTALLWCFIISTLAGARAGGYEHAISPDRRFEAYTTPRNPDGTGMRLLLRRKGDPGEGVLLRENDRWIEAKWSPDSRFLALIDGVDGHITDIYVYRVQPSRAAEVKVTWTMPLTVGQMAASAQAPQVAARLWYHTPHPWTYDVQWGLAGWGASSKTILLTIRGR